MKSLKMNLDLENDLVVLDNEVIKLTCTTTGHYRLPLTHFYVDACNITLHAIDFDKLDVKQKKVKAYKLHRQFSHAPGRKLVKPVENSKVNDKEFIKSVKEVCENCELCKRYKHAPLKPVVSLSLSETFNELVCYDLKEVKKSWILHMIDAASNSAARIIKKKDKDTAIKDIFQMWFQGV